MRGGRAGKTALLECAQEHDGAGDRQSEAEDQRLNQRNRQERAKPKAEQRHRRHLTQGARQGKPPACDKLGGRKFQPHSEHDQDHANLGEFACQIKIERKAGRIMSDQHAGQKIADNRRKPEPMRHKSERKGGDNAADHHCQKWVRFGHNLIP